MGELLFDGKLHFHVAAVVALEGFPFLWGVLWKILGPAAVFERRLAGRAEIADQMS